MSTIQEATKEYTALNQYAQKNKVAILGASTAAHLAIGELLQDYEISTKVYNRSVEAITIKEAVPFAKTCIVPLKPSRLLLQLGETELETIGLSIQEIMDQYKWLLYELHTQLPETQLFLGPVLVDHPQRKTFNHALSSLAKEYGCNYLECELTEKNGVSLPFFRGMKDCLIEKDSTICDAMHIAAI